MPDGSRIPRISELVLVVHGVVQVARAGDGETPGGKRLAALWRACGALGMTGPAGDDLPDLTSAEAAWRIRAERRGTSAAAGDRALLWSRGQLAGLSVRLTPGPMEDGAALLARWEGATGQATPDERVLGEAIVLCAVGRLARRRDGRTGARVVALTDRLGLPPVGLEAWGRLADGVLLWEPGPAGRWPRERRLVALAPPGRRPDAAFWSEYGAADLAPTALHLMHAAQARHHLHVLGTQRGAVEADYMALGNATDTLGRWHARALSTASPLGRLTEEMARAMERLRGDTHTLAAARADLATLARSGDLILANLRAAVPPTPDERPGSPLARDRVLAASLAETAGDLGRDVEETLERARSVIDLAGGFVAAESERRRAHGVTVQMSVIAGIVMLFGAVQAFQFRIHLAPVLAAPLICAAASVALAAPAGIQRLLPGGRPPSAPLLFDSVTLGTVAGTCSWLLCTFLGHLDGQGAAPAVLSLTAGLCMAIVVTVVSAYAFRRAR
ncbi:MULTISPECIES: CATRA conflict system CASPASE/TPR repeat-associated protein [unclassified Streptomyces]|uniref:CATRA conflict system CASPASE/TPR repeat-associated protein n=1 Tax=unclassified Streptomyces TaxID=2593676 RepID=UPI00381CAC6F